MSVTPRSCRILTTTTKPDYPPWGDRTEMLPGWKEEVERVWRTKQGASLLSDCRWALRIYRSASRYDAVVTGFERSAWLFALLRRVTFTRRPRHVFLDAHPALSANPMARAVRKWLFKQVFLSAQSVVVFSEKQRDLWAELFDVPVERFAVIPYWATASVERVAEPTLGDYVFAGGDEERDYKTLIEAVRGSPYRLVIAALRRNHFDGIAIPPNVEIVTVKHEGFVKLLSNAGCVVVSLKKDTIRYAGQQTYLNAMLFKKPVIVACEGAYEYIAHGKTGLISAPGDAVQIGGFIDYCMTHKESAKSLGEAAHKSAGYFTADRYFGGIFKLAENCAERFEFGEEIGGETR